MISDFFSASQMKYDEHYAGNRLLKILYNFFNIIGAFYRGDILEIQRNAKQQF